MRRLATACIILAVAACGGQGSDPATEESAARTQEQPSDPTGSAVATSASPTRGAAAAPHIPLTRENVSRWMDASNETNRIADADPEMTDAVDFGASVDAADAAARIRRSPEFVSALQNHGFTPEEFVGFMATLSGAMEAHHLREAGESPGLPANVREGDVRFIAENRDWLMEQWARLD